MKKILYLLIRVTLPFVFLMNACVLLFAPWFLKAEYQKSNFPPDEYGFNMEERFEYGSKSILYITQNYDDSYLAELRFPDGSPIYNERELSHMRDVKEVFQGSRFALTILMVLYLLVFIYTASHPSNLPTLCATLRDGSVFTLVLIGLVIAGVLIDFDALFEGFHKIFFQGDTWLFYINDTLIRLYPEMLWSDAFIYLGLITAISAVLVFFITEKALKGFQKVQKRR